VPRMEWTAPENQVSQNRCKLMEMCFQDSLKKPCGMLTSFAVLSPRFGSVRASLPLLLGQRFPAVGARLKVRVRVVNYWGVAPVCPSDQLSRCHRVNFITRIWHIKRGIWEFSFLDSLEIPTQGQEASSREQEKYIK
jgi:hypothetical protein